MAETTNNFTGGRMNKDIDDRLLPENEYRNAVNLQISKTENSDVGALQTILGNELVLDFNVLTGVSNLDCIGYFVDTANNRVFLFLTNYTSPATIPNYSPDADNYIYVYNILQNTYVKLVEGAFLNFSKNSPIIGVNLLENLLFWTDNRNQPRKINVDRANPNNLATPVYYTNEDQISVAKISPVYAPDLYADSTITGAIGDPETTMYDVTSEFLPNGDPNPYYDAEFIGDPAYLEDKFVRFSYRFRFDDNEYSIFAPFTQIAFIPKQDGYFLYEENPDPLQEPLIDNETAAFRSTVVSFMYNKVNNIFLQIKLPCPANQLQSICKISEIDILYKESDGLAVQVVDVIPVSEIAAQEGASDIYVYNYQSKKPFKTLPERDLIRVYDKTPVRALGQEIISNRVVYSNYQDKQGYPKYLNYNVVCDNKLNVVEYPNHSVKQNRNYEVGIVLSDKFGRQSGVILSNATLPAEVGDVIYGAASLYVPYFKEDTPGSNIPQSIINQWPGYSLKILFNQVISDNGISDWPGIYQGEPESPDYNPLGWYSYKVVVKQNEQDYYNVYLPGVMAAYPTEPEKELDKTSHFVLIGDNINKVPRDLNDISGSQEQYRSSVRLYSRVNNIYDLAETELLNQQFYPGNTFGFVNTIATLNSLFPDASGAATTYDPKEYFQFYQNTTNPLIGRMSTVNRVGRNTDALPGPSEFVPDAPAELQRLAVLETDPFDSRLDLYWETSTSGIIEDLNKAIVADTDAPYALSDWSFELFEDAEPGTIVAEDFYFSDIFGDLLEFSLGDLSLQVTDFNDNPIINKFVITAGTTTDKFNLETNTGAYFYYGYEASTIENYKFRITVTAPDSGPSPFNKTGSLGNIAPIIDDHPESVTIPVGQADVYQFIGFNGSADVTKYQDDLTWEVVSFGDEFFMDNRTPGLLAVQGADVGSGEYEVTVRLTDAGGAFVDTDITVIIIEDYGVSWIVTDPVGGGIVSTGTEPAGEYSATGTITVSEGVTATIRAGAFPWNFATTDRVVSSVTITGEGTVSADYSFPGGGYSTSAITLVGGTGGTSYAFDIFVTYVGTGGGQGGMYIN
jgi:hypothetical protein